MHNKTLRRAGAVIALGIAVELISGAATAATFTVNNRGDADGACTAASCTLRQAITAANATTAADTIKFSISCGLQSINITGDTLRITHPVTIDGTTQPVCRGATPGDRASRIELRGQGVTVFRNGDVFHGLVLDAGSSGSRISGLAINGFSGDGVAVATSNNAITENKFGTTADGTAARPNNIGVALGTQSNNNTVSDNIISGNMSEGVDVFGSGNGFDSNLIGTSVDGETPLGNGSDGIVIGTPGFGADDNVIGLEPSAGNTIAFNAGIGVHIFSGTSNEVFANKIFSNANVGVKLDGGGVNDDQVAPVLTSAARISQTVTTPFPHVVFNTTIRGTLAQVSGSAFVVDLYGNDSCDPSGAGEGQVFLATANVSAPANRVGTGSFSATTAISPGSFITAIARAPDGSTSQFSRCEAVTQ